MKMVINVSALQCFCIVSIDFHGDVNDLQASANESKIFSFV